MKRVEDLPLVLKNQLPLPTLAADVATANRVAVDPARIGAAVRKLREELSYTQTHLANLAGLRREHVSQIERGCLQVGLDRLGRVCTALGVRVCDLLGLRSIQ